MKIPENNRKNMEKQEKAMKNQPDVAKHDGDNVTTLGEIYSSGAPPLERYTVEQIASSIVLTYTCRNSAEYFFIPTDLRSWFAGLIAPTEGPTT